MITILAIGKKHESWITEGLERYQKRLRQPWNVEWVLLPHSSQEGPRARQEESERLLTRLGDVDYVLLLDETGKNISTPELTSLLDTSFTTARHVVIIIGGAYGVTEELRARSQFVWSLSRLVFPHQLVRLMLTEQLYRAEQISRNTGYHHI
jgi:23S rRNA (pseudouridine1915-N3)-methyltransferase